MQKKKSIADELQKISELRKDDLLTETEFQTAKKRILHSNEETIETVDTHNAEETNGKGLKRKVSAFDIIVSITILLCVIILNGGLIGGAILGALLGLLAYISSRITHSTIGRIFIFLFFASIPTIIGTMITHSDSYDLGNNNATTYTNTSLIDYQNCTKTAHTSYQTRWDKTCIDIGKENDCFLPSETVSSYDDSLQNELDRCASQYASKIPNSSESYSDCRTSVYDSYTERWNGSCENLGKEKDCSLPSNTSDAYEATRERELNRCLILYQE